MTCKARLGIGIGAPLRQTLKLRVSSKGGSGAGKGEVAGRPSQAAEASEEVPAAAAGSPEGGSGACCWTLAARGWTALRLSRRPSWRSCDGGWAWGVEVVGRP